MTYLIGSSITVDCDIDRICRLRCGCEGVDVAEEVGIPICGATYRSSVFKDGWSSYGSYCKFAADISSESIETARELRTSEIQLDGRWCFGDLVCNVLVRGQQTDLSKGALEFNALALAAGAEVDNLVGRVCVRNVCREGVYVISYGLGIEYLFQVIGIVIQVFYQTLIHEVGPQYECVGLGEKTCIEVHRGCCEILINRLYISVSQCLSVVHLKDEAEVVAGRVHVVCTAHV